MAHSGPAANVAPGEVIGGYELDRLLGAGSTSKVFLGRHTLLGRQAAIKVLAQDLVSNQDVVSRLLMEARVVNDIRHPNIIDIIDFVVTEKPRRVALVMELIEGPSLMTLRGHAFTVEQALGIALQLVDAVAGAHAAGVIHRDIKPDNLLLTDDVRDKPGVPTLKVVDFGIAKLAGKSGRTATGMMLGTPAYMAPEQVAGRPPPSTATDVFAIGEVLYELLAGERAYPSQAIHETVRAKLRGELPDMKLPDHVPSRDRVMALIVQCLERRPEDRPTLKAVKETLVEIFPSNWRPSASLAERLIANTLGTGPYPLPDTSGPATTELTPMAMPGEPPPPAKKSMSILAVPNVEATMDPATLDPAGGRADEVTDRSADDDQEFASTQLAFDDEVVQAPTLPPVAETELASAAGIPSAPSSPTNESLSAIDTSDTAVTMLGRGGLMSPAGVADAPETNPAIPDPTANRATSRLTKELELAVDSVAAEPPNRANEAKKRGSEPDASSRGDASAVVESGRSVHDPARQRSTPSFLGEMPAVDKSPRKSAKPPRVWSLIFLLWIIATALLAFIFLLPKAPTPRSDVPPPPQNGPAATPTAVGPITINSDPQGARVVDVASGAVLGTTPLSLTELQRNKLRRVRLEGSDAKTAEIDLSSSSGNVWIQLD